MNRRVLIVDDNEDAAEMLAEVLKARGYETRTSYDGPSALGVLENFQPDVAILDIGLPVMDGYELGRLIRKSPAFRRLHLIAVTGYGQAGDLERTAAAGFDAHLVKPVALDRLAALLESPRAEG